MDENLLPQGKALQFHRCSFCRWNCFWELHFYFRLILPHHPCEHKIDAKAWLNFCNKFASVPVLAQSCSIPHYLPN